MKKISIVVPCHNEQEALPLFYDEMDKISRQMQYVEFELLFINDGSKDKTLDILRQLARQDKRVRYLSFSRNFFKEAAMLAGLEHATGDYIAVMDADLQDPPHYLIDMYSGIVKEGYDCVGIRRVNMKGEGMIRSFMTKIYYKIINKLSSIEMISGARDFRLMTRQMVNAILELKEYNRYSKGIFSFVGFDTKWLEYQNVKRVAGEGQIKFGKLVWYALEAIVSFSTAPLMIASVLGLLFCLIAFIAVIFIIVKTIAFGDPVTGWPSLACIIFFVGGIQLFCMGIIGQYLSKAYLETKKRPIYIIKETDKENGLDNKHKRTR